MNALAVLPALPASFIFPSGLSSSLMASWRRLQGISQAELAQRLGIAEDEVVRLEHLRMGSVG